MGTDAGGLVDAGGTSDVPGTGDAPGTVDTGGVDCSGRPAGGPSPRGEVYGELDEARGRIVVFGGNTAAPEMCMPRYEITAEAWAFHLDCASWEPITAPGPSTRARVATTLDSMRDRMIVFGGRQRLGFGAYENYADVWAFDFATDTWSEITTTGTGPSPRSSSSIVYDAGNDRIVVFGGDTGTDGLSLVGQGDTFELDLSTGVWTEITGAGPSARLYHSAAAIGGVMYVFGGTPNFSGPFLSDTWALDLTTDTWSFVAVTSASEPEPRFGAQMVAAAGPERLFVFGGHDGTDLGNRNDVWELDVATGAWSTPRPGDTLNGVPAGACMFPADFTIPEATAPERRYAFTRAADASGAYFAFGKADCGNLNDVVRYDFSTNGWTLLRPSTGGEACNRTGRIGCTTLCF